jgi:hypothetical protein
MLSKFIRQKIEEKFGHALRYSKQCDALAAHINEVCKLTISPSTLRRLLGFVKNKAQPRDYSLDILAAYVDHKSWTHLLAALDGNREIPEKAIEKLSATQVKKGQAVQIAYEPGKQVEIRKVGATFNVLSTNDKKILLNDVVDFRLIELHYPLTFTSVIREGKNIGRVQVATVSGVTGILKH